MISNHKTVILIVAQDADLREMFEAEFYSFLSHERDDYEIITFSCSKKAMAQIPEINATIAFAFVILSAADFHGALEQVGSLFKYIIYRNRHKAFADGVLFGTSIQFEGEFTIPCDSSEFYFGSFKVFSHTPGDIINAYTNRRDEIIRRSEKPGISSLVPLMSSQDFEEAVREALGLGRQDNGKGLRHCVDFILRFWKQSGSTLDHFMPVPKKSLLEGELSDYTFSKYVEPMLKKAGLFTFKAEPGDVQYDIKPTTKGRQFMKETLATHHVYLNDIDHDVKADRPLESV